MDYLGCGIVVVLFLVMVAVPFENVFNVETWMCKIKKNKNKGNEQTPKII